MKQQLSKFLFVLFLLLIFAACKEEVYIPKPKAYHRIDMPKKEFQKFSSDFCPITFQYPTYSEVQKKTKYFNEAPEHPCWLNLSIPYFNSTLHLTYVEVNTPEKLEQSINDAFKYAMKHVQKADYIDETTIQNEKLNGKLFDLGGDVASNIQFYVTDSINHFFRGSLYFNEQPNVDSLRPAIDFLREDIMLLMKSIEWK